MIQVPPRCHASGHATRLLPSSGPTFRGLSTAMRSRPGTCCIAGSVDLCCCMVTYELAFCVFRCLCDMIYIYIYVYIICSCTALHCHSKLRMPMCSKDVWEFRVLWLLGAAQSPEIVFAMFSCQTDVCTAPLLSLGKGLMLNIVKSCQQVDATVDF